MTQEKEDITTYIPIFVRHLQDSDYPATLSWLPATNYNFNHDKTGVFGGQKENVQSRVTKKLLATDSCPSIPAGSGYGEDCSAKLTDSLNLTRITTYTSIPSPLRTPSCIS